MDRNLKIGVVGLGLIGGSIFKALCALGCDVYGVSRSNPTIEQAKKYSPHISKSLLQLKKCDVIFVCTPMNKTKGILDKLDKILPKSAIVADVASIKGFVCDKVRPYKFVPTHPMAGTENSGFENSYELLFQGAKWVLVPCPKGNAKAPDIKKLTDIICALGAKPVCTTAEEHDEAVALISHMPMLIAQALFLSAKDNSLAMKLASSGFRDMTRLALSNDEMATDMISLNPQYIQKALLKLYSSVGDLLDKDYPKKIREIKKERQAMYVSGQNIL